jgi:hypothetical protein
MSQWGKLDRVNLPGTATVAQNAANVVFSQSQTANVAIGYALVVANVEYVIANIVSATEVTLDVNYEATSSASQGGLAIQQQPKGLRTYGWGGQGAANLINGANTVNVRNVYGIDAIEANVASNKAKGISHTGWVHYQTWTNTQGTVRNRAEVLVAMSKNFNKSNVDFNIGVDANDDAVISDNQIVITAQPANNGRTANAQFFGASYSITATGTNGMVPTYSWQKSPNLLVWTDVINTPYAGAVGFTGNTTANLVVSNVYLGINTVNVYIRALVSGNAAATVTSDAVRVLANGPQ